MGWKIVFYAAAAGKVPARTFLDTCPLCMGSRSAASARLMTLGLYRCGLTPKVIGLCYGDRTMLRLQKHARPLTATTVAAVVVFAGAALAPAAVAKTPSTLQGTVSWKTTTSTNKDIAGGDATSGTETRTVTMKVKMTKRRAFYWQVEDNGSSYTGRYTASGQTLQRDYWGNVDCTVTGVGSGNAAGKLPKKPRSTSAPSLGAEIVPGTSSLGSRTKAIGLSANLRYSGQETITSTGSGLSPCESGQSTNPVDGSLSPSNGAMGICYPAGTSSKTAIPAGSNLVGAWNRGKKAFIFNCQTTWNSGEGQQTTTTVTGTLKLK